MTQLKKLREYKDVSQQEIADYLGVTRQSYSNYEMEKREPDFNTLNKLSQYFHVPVSFLIEAKPFDNWDIKEKYSSEIIAAMRDIINIDELLQKFSISYSGIPLDKFAMLLDSFLSCIVVDVSNNKLVLTDFMGNTIARNISDLKKEVISFTNGDYTQKKKGIKIPVLGYVRAGIPIEAIEEILDYEEISQEMAIQGEYFGLSVKGDSMEPRIQEGDVVIVRKQSDVDSGDIAVVLVNGNDATVKKFVKHENGISLVAFNQKYEPMFYTCQEVEEKPISVVGKVVELRGKF